MDSTDNSGMPETDRDGSDTAPKETEQAAQPAGPPKNQLRRRVDARIAKLETALERLSDDPANHKQVRAIVEALKGARNSMNLNGDHMGSMEAAQMARWLESTQHLAVST